MAVNYRNQFITINPTESITTRLTCKCIYVGASAGALYTINDGAAAELFKLHVGANDTIALIGPFNLDNGIAAPAAVTLTLVT